MHSGSQDPTVQSTWHEQYHKEIPKIEILIMSQTLLVSVAAFFGTKGMAGRSKSEVSPRPLNMMSSKLQSTTQISRLFSRD